MKQGTPWWLTVILMVASAFLTNILAVRREKRKASSDFIAGWRRKFSDNVASVCDAAAHHYSDVDNIKNTHTSSCLILNGLKRVAALRREIIFIDLPNEKKFSDAYLYLHCVITGAEDFQIKDRSARAATDDIFDKIRDAEEAITQLSLQRIRMKNST